MSTQLVNPKNNLKTLITGDAMKAQFAAALPKHLSVDRFCRIAITALSRTPKLMDCTQESLMKCLLDLSAYGLEPDGRRAHLIPYGNVATLILDWKGLAELAMRSGIIAKLHADIVCENDEFDFNLGEIVKHKIDFKKDRGPMYAAYAMAVTKDGPIFVQVLTKDEIDGIRKRSKSGNNGPWVTDYSEMAKKTAFRRLAKWLPLSAEFRDATEAEDDLPPPERDVTPSRSAPVPELLRDAPVMPPYVPSSDKETIPERETWTRPLEEQQDAPWDAPWDAPEPERKEPLPQAPKVTYTEPPPAEVAKPKEPEKAKAPNWKEHRIHFGKDTEGKKLGEIPKQTLRWFQTEWMTKIKEADPTVEDAALMRALEASIQPHSFPA